MIKPLRKPRAGDDLEPEPGIWPKPKPGPIPEPDDDDDDDDGDD